MSNDTGDALWFAANVMVAILAIAIGFYDGMISAIAVWGILTVILMWFRPQ